MKNLTSSCSFRRLAGGIAALGLYGGQALACDAYSGGNPADGTAYIGTICTYLGGSCPQGSMTANGQKIYVKSSPALYAVIGTAFGFGSDSNGQYFNLPNLQGILPVGTSASGPAAPPSPYSRVSIGQKRGSEFATVSINNFPNHKHDGTVGFTSNQLFSFSPNISLQVSTAPTSQSPTPDGHPYLGSLSSADETLMQMWATNMLGPVQIGGFSASYNATSAAYWIKKGLGVNLEAAGDSITTNIPTIPPQMALTYCIVSEGKFPSRP